MELVRGIVAMAAGAVCGWLLIRRFPLTGSRWANLAIASVAYYIVVGLILPESGLLSREATRSIFQLFVGLAVVLFAVASFTEVSAGAWAMSYLASTLILSQLPL